MRILVLALLFGLFFACNNGGTPTQPMELISNDGVVLLTSGFTPMVRICTWMGDKKAAYTIGFDDARESHYLVSAPEINKRHMVGTFYINTRTLQNWQTWRSLHEEGHEIASHTWSHYNCTELSEDDLHWELFNAKLSILHNIPAMKEVPSFSYPFGLYNEEIKKIVALYHVSARAGSGLNGSDLSDDALMAVKGISVYPPYGLRAINDSLTKVIKKEGWMLAYFHSVSRDVPKDDYTISLESFLQYLDNIELCRDSLWIATQGQVVSYMKTRQNTVLDARIVQNKFIEVSMRMKVELHESLRSKISFAINLPQEWTMHTLLIKKSDRNDFDVIEYDYGEFVYDIEPGNTINIAASVE